MRPGPFLFSLSRERLGIDIKECSIEMTLLSLTYSLSVWWLPGHKSLKNWLTDWLSVWLINWLIDWLKDGLTDWWTNWQIDGRTDWLMDGWTDRLMNGLTDWLTEWLTDWLIDGRRGWLTDRQSVSQSISPSVHQSAWFIDGRTDWRTDWLNDCRLTDWLTDGLTDQLTDRLTGCLTDCPTDLTDWLTDLPIDQRTVLLTVGRNDWLIVWLIDCVSQKRAKRSKMEVWRPPLAQPWKKFVAFIPRKCFTLLSNVVPHIIMAVRLAYGLFLSFLLKVDLAMDVEKALPRTLRKRLIPEREVVRPNQYEGFKRYWYSPPISAQEVQVALKPNKVSANKSISNKKVSSWDT